MINTNGEFIFDRWMKKTTLSYIYNPNTEKENLGIMNNALKKSDRMNTR